MNEIITSLQNSKVKELVKFRKKNGKTEKDSILIEDEREIVRALEVEIQFIEAYICEELLSEKESELLDCVVDRADKIIKVSKTVFQKVAYKSQPLGIIVKAEFKTSEFSEIYPGTDSILVIESIEKPGNLGALIRTADGAGIDTILVCNKITDYRNPNVIRSSTGTIFSKKIIECSSKEAVDYLKRAGFSIVSADPYGDKFYYEADYSGKTAFVVGSEAYGLSEEMKKSADFLVKIPMKGVADSLNVNQAATIILYESLRQSSI